MKKITINLIMLVFIVAFVIFAYFFNPNPLIKDISVSIAILYFFILVILLKRKDDRQQPGEAQKSKGIYSEFYKGIYIGFGIVLGINFFIQLFTDDETMKMTSRVFTYTYAAILGIIYLIKRSK